MPVRLAICEFPDRDLSLTQQIRGTTGHDIHIQYILLFCKMPNSRFVREYSQSILVLFSIYQILIFLTRILGIWSKYIDVHYIFSLFAYSLSYLRSKKHYHILIICKLFFNYNRCHKFVFAYLKTDLSYCSNLKVY